MSTDDPNYFMNVYFRTAAEVENIAMRVARDVYKMESRKDAEDTVTSIEHWQALAENYRMDALEIRALVMEAVKEAVAKAEWQPGSEPPSSHEFQAFIKRLRDLWMRGRWYDDALKPTKMFIPRCFEDEWLDAFHIPDFAAIRAPGFMDDMPLYRDIPVEFHDGPLTFKFNL